MTITQLKYALAIAEHKNFTKAAEKCFVTQPTLSTQIQKLEDELDVGALGDCWRSRGACPRSRGGRENKV